MLYGRVLVSGLFDQVFPEAIRNLTERIYIKTYQERCLHRVVVLCKVPQPIRKCLIEEILVSDYLLCLPVLAGIFVSINANKIPLVV